MITIEEINKLVAHELACSDLTREDADLEVWIDVVRHPTFDIVDGETVMHVGPDGSNPGHEIQTINFRRLDTRGLPVTCSIVLATGEGSPHMYKERPLAEIEALVCQQVNAALHESTTKPRTAEEHVAWEAKMRADAAAREKARELAHLAEQRALMSPEQLAHHEYVTAHKEPPYIEGTLEKARKVAPVLVRTGRMTAEESAYELARLETWKNKHAGRVKTS